MFYAIIFVMKTEKIHQKPSKINIKPSKNRAILKSLIIKISLIFVVVGLDILTKVLFYGKSFSVIESLIGVREQIGLNTGGAWGVMSGNMTILIVFTFIFLAGVVVEEFLCKITHPLFSVALSFIVGGAVGNLIDRISLGGVRDFIFFEFWQSFPTFNVADSFLCIGMILLLIFVLFVYQPKQEQTK